MRVYAPRFPRSPIAMPFAATSPCSLPFAYYRRLVKVNCFGRYFGTVRRCQVPRMDQAFSKSQYFFKFICTVQCEVF